MSLLKRVSFFALLFGALFCSLLLFAEKVLLDGFSPKHIVDESSSLVDQDKPSTPNRETLLLLSQNFFYKGKGSQCYVFESADKQFVLKFFRLNRYHRFSLSSYFSLPSFVEDIENKKRALKKEKLDALYTSCRLAYGELQKESGLIYLHLGKTDDLHLKVTCYDNLKRSFTVDLDETPFLIQKKAEPVYPYLAGLIKEHKKEEAKKALTNLLSLLKERCQKGIFDNDSQIAKNAGFIANKAIFIDTGQFQKNVSYQNPEVAQAEIEKITRKLQFWLKEKDPELALYFQQRVKQI